MKKSHSIIRAYAYGWGSILFGAMMFIGGVFAWRTANALYDKVTKKEK